MNATSLFVSTSRVVLQADEDISSWSDLHRLVPYLRQSLSCTVCSNLLIEPYTPTETSCQHHVCRTCRGGRKKLKPSCSWCKDYDTYVENVLLRILLQCYKKLCVYITSTSIYPSLLAGSSSLADLINEGAGFKDDYKSTAGLSRSAYSILPCVYSSSSTQTQAAVTPASANVPASSASDSTNVTERPAPVTTQPISNGSALYSVINIGSKMTFKRKGIINDTETVDSGSTSNTDQSRKSTKSITIGFKKPHKGPKAVRSVGHATLKQPLAVVKQAGKVANVSTTSNNPNLKRRGCRCGNATATPGKLTCCGQRCPCYVDSKACMDCRCKGCRNPHRPGGHKVRPHIPELESYQLQLSSQGAGSMQTLDQNTSVLSLASPGDLAASNAGATVQVLGVYTTQLHPVSEVTGSLPAALLVGDESTAIDDSSEVDTSDVEVDC